MFIECSGNDIVKDVEGFIISSKDEAVPAHVQTVERERLPAHQTVSLHPVLHCLVAQPGRDCVQSELGGVAVHPGAVPVTDVTTWVQLRNYQTSQNVYWCLLQGDRKFMFFL